MKYLATLLPVLFLSACDPFGLPESPPEMAAYYVSNGEVGVGTKQSTVASRIAIAYQSPEGLVRDTLIAPDTLVLTTPRPRSLGSWSRVFDHEVLPEFSITATNLTVPNDSGDVGFVSVSLLIDQKTVAFDTSRTEVTLSY